MEFHKTKGTLLGIGVVVAALGGLGTALLIGWFFEGGKLPVLLFLAPIAVLAGIGVVVYAMLPFRLRIDANGVTTRNPPEGLNTFVPWSHVAAVTIEAKPGDKPDRAPYVVLWPVPGARIGADPSFHRHGRPAHLLGQTDEIKQPRDQIRDAIAHYSGSAPTQQPPAAPPHPPRPMPPQYGPQHPPQHGYPHPPHHGPPPVNPYHQGHWGYPGHPGH
ncbi:hypothetical protein [Halostreptopolyspora alba]|uniref:hypothetical protein n=1 Tax=Halostreptopolyspora alba TaxID=2487137 RepID=UPI0026D2DD51